MSENIFEERNNTSYDYYKTEDFEDNDLQSELYAKIYYESNVDLNESKTEDVTKIARFDSIIDESNIETENQCIPEDEQPIESEADRSVVGSVIHGDASIEPVESAQTSIDNDRISSDKETNSTLNEPDNVNKTPQNSPTIKEKKNMINSSKKHKKTNRSKHTKNNYQDDLQVDNAVSTNDSEICLKHNVLQKHAKEEMLIKKLNKILEISDSSDSEQSIFEIPIPPKPKPLLIDLQDSDEEDNKNSEIDVSMTVYHMNTPRKHIPERCDNKDSPKKTKSALKNYNYDYSSMVKGWNNREVTNSKNKNKSPRNKNTSTDKRLQTPTPVQELEENIVLNCTAVQKGAGRNINEIRQLSKNAITEMHKNQDALTAERNSSKGPQNTSKSIPQNASNVTHQKRQHDNENESNPAMKRQCIGQQNDQNVTPQCNSGGEGNSESSGKHFFNPMSEKLRNRYYSTPIQENFSVAEMQRNMSKDPQMWAILDEDIIPISFDNKHVKIRCMNCQQNGHRRSDCPMPRKAQCCYMCGMQGHTEFRCPKKMCLTCGKQQNAFRKTCEYCRVLYCTMCNSIGHKMQQCPDLWRRYHQTISMDNVPPQDPGNVIKPPNLLHCCNCTKSGHESSTCKEYRWSRHFFTPAAVSDYIGGPMYTMPTVNSSETNLDTNISTPEITSDKIPISQSPRNTRQATGECAEPPANIEALPSSSNKTPLLPTMPLQAPLLPTPPLQTPQEVCVQETRKKSYSPVIFDESSCSKNNQKKKKENKLNEMDFTNVLYNCGRFYKKNEKNVMLMLQDISKIKIRSSYFTAHRRQIIIDNLVARKIAPVFLEKLQEKIEFEVKIGFVRQCKNLMMQVIAYQDYVDYIYQLLVHWIRIPDEEKDYGIDMTLPINPLKMYNLLKSRKPQLKNMRFLSYEENIKSGENDPRWLFRNIKQKKANLERYKGTNEYFRLRTKLWRLQTRLLMIVNTEYKYNTLVANFWTEMTNLSKLVSKPKEKLCDVDYLKLTLLYNRLFVPHTPQFVQETLNHFENYEKKMRTNMNCPSQTQQVLEMTTSRKQENLPLYTNENACPSQTQQRLEMTTSRQQENLPLYIDENATLSPAISCSMQNIDFVEDPSVTIRQNVHDNMSIERNDLNDFPPGTSDVTNDMYSCNDIYLIDNDAQNFQTITPLTTEPTPMQSEYREEYREKEFRLLRSGVSYRIDTKVYSKKYMEKMQKKKLKKLTNTKISQKKHKKALKCIVEAREFKITHMMNAADELQRKINNNKATLQHIDTLEKLIQLERKHQKNVKNYCNSLQVPQ